ncbi:MAG TPA: DUF5658 family protein [Pyrinomonadaceae bacterium]
MSAWTKSVLLFVLNLLDAQLTVVWVEMGVATEGNALMARVLEAGTAHFLLTKLLIGALVAYTLYRFSHLALARRGLGFVLGLYFLLMFVHAAAGMSAMGFHAPDAFVAFVSHLPDRLLALLA